MVVDLTIGYRSPFAMRAPSVLLKLSAECHALLPCHLLEWRLVCVPIRAVEKYDVAGFVMAFAFPGATLTLTLTHGTYPFWAVPVFAIKLTDQGVVYGSSPLKVETYTVFVTRIGVTFTGHRRK